MKTYNKCVEFETVCSENIIKIPENFKVNGKIKVLIMIEEENGEKEENTFRKPLGRDEIYER